MSTAYVQANITSLGRLGLALCLAILSHAIVILGVTFTSEDRLTPRFDTMEIILVQQKDHEPVNDAQLLTQASLHGEGEAEDPIKLSTPLPAPFQDTQPKLVSPPEELPRSELILEDKLIKNKTLGTTKEQALTQLAATSETLEVAITKQKPKETIVKPKEKPSATQLLRNSFEIASLSAQIKRKLEAKSRRPRRTFISASTKSYKYAAFMEAWRTKIERVGNLNYPDEARKQKFSGNLILDVALNPDGSVNDIVIRRSSNYKILDDAAIRIVNLASPFAPFPGAIRKETDILHITRTWQFLK